MSLLHLIVSPLRLLGLVIVTVALMKEPLLKVTCATSEESSIRFVTGDAKRYTNAQAMIFLYKRCCSKTRSIFLFIKKNFFRA